MTYKNANWELGNASGKVDTWEKVGIAVLMDIREELRKLNSTLQCPNFLAIPLKLGRIAKNTAKRKRKP